MGESRGKFVAKLQKVYREHKVVEEDLKADSEAWSKLMCVAIAT
jgi:hypothetical protein